MRGTIVLSLDRYTFLSLKLTTALFPEQSQYYKHILSNFRIAVYLSMYNANNSWISK